MMEKNLIKSGRNPISDRLLVFSFLLVIFFVPFFAEAKGTIDLVCVVSFVINGLLFVVGIYQATDRHSLSMELIYWLFMFVFMYFAPLIQYLMKIFPWRGAVNENEVLKANVLIFLFNVFFVCGCLAARRIKVVGVPSVGLTNWLCSNLKFGKRSKVFLTVLVCLCTIYSLSKTGLEGIFVSRAQAVRVFYSGGNSGIELIIESVVPAFFAYVVAEAAHSMVEKEEKGFRFWLLFVCLLICFFPTAIPRYKTATIYGVVCILLFPWVRKNSSFFWLFSIGLFVVFPLLHAFRYVISNDSIQKALNEGFFESYTDGNYDAWRMLVSAIRYSELRGSTFGRQLLGSFLFFVPRSIWPSKPIGSGAMLIMNELGSSTFSNVSCPLVAEGFVNFGFVGVVLFAFALGQLLTILDQKYWRRFDIDNNVGVFAPYLFLLFMLFFVLRGDFLSGFAYVCGFVITGYFLKPFASKA